MWLRRILTQYIDAVNHTLDDEMGGRMEARAEVIIENLRVPARYAVGEPDKMYGEH